MAIDPIVYELSSILGISDPLAADESALKSATDAANAEHLT